LPGSHISSRKHWSSESGLIRPTISNKGSLHGKPMQMHHNISGFVMNPWQLTKSGFGVPGDGFLIPPPPLSKHEDKFWDEMAIAFVPWERHYRVKNCLGVQVLIGKAGKFSKGNPDCPPSVAPPSFDLGYRPLPGTFLNGRSRTASLQPYSTP
jgi:hypothetical protein